MNNIFCIEKTPAVVYGGASDKGFIYVHGQGGNKEEGERFSLIAEKFGYQTLSVDLPEHGGRTDGAKFEPWFVTDELEKVIDYAEKKWNYICVRAVSIGSWFSLLSFKNRRIEKCLFSSPLVDMENMICSMMKLAGVSEDELKEKQEIKTQFGQTLSWRYLCYARENRVHALCRDTSVLYAKNDELIPFETVEKFVDDNKCSLTLIEKGEHWLHTADDLKLVEKWETESVSDG